MGVNLIVAVGNYIKGKGYPIGLNGVVPWKCKSDMKWFKETTMGHPVIMGRRTWDSLIKPLSGRENIIVSKSASNSEPKIDEHVYMVSSVEEAIKLAKSISKEEPFIIGGEKIYKYALSLDLVDNVYIDLLSEDVQDADAFFPDIFKEDRWFPLCRAQEIEPNKAQSIILYRVRGNHNADGKYIKLVNDIIKNGEPKDTRAGKTLSLFSRQLRFNLKEGLPMLTTKKMFSKGVIYELLWFLKGDTNIKYLVDHNVHIWDDDAYRYYLELLKISEGPLGLQNALTKEQFLIAVKEGDTEKWVIDKTSNADGTYNYYRYGDLNRVYGAQWTNWGGHNQIEEVINTLKTNPDDRRMIISAWNVDEIPDMALPPCHFCCQFYTRKLTKEERYYLMYDKIPYLSTVTIDSVTDEQLDKMGIPTRKLSCVWHQRSVDVLLGLPFNIMSYAILTHMIAQCANMDVDELIFDGGDVHIYENQIGIYESEQKDRFTNRYALPKLVLNKDIKEIKDFTYDDIKIEGYESYPPIKYPLSVGL